MIIERKSNNYKIFSVLIAGQCFIDENDSICMKVSYNDDDNAFCFDENYLYSHDKDEMVIPIDCKIVEL